MLDVQPVWVWGSREVRRGIPAFASHDALLYRWILQWCTALSVETNDCPVRLLVRAQGASVDRTSHWSNSFFRCLSAVGGESIHRTQVWIRVKMSLVGILCVHSNALSVLTERLIFCPRCNTNFYVANFPEKCPERSVKRGTFPPLSSFSGRSSVPSLDLQPKKW